MPDNRLLRVLQPPPIALSAAVELFLVATEAKGASPRTLDAYRAALDRFTAHATAERIPSVAAITPAAIRAYMATLQRSGLKASSISDYMRPVKTWLRFLHRDGLLQDDPFARVDMPRQEKQILPVFSPADVKALLSACLSDRDRALVLTLLDTGARAAEFCALRLDDLDRREGSLTIRAGKGRKDRTVFAGSRTRHAILRYLLHRPDAQPEDPLFPARSGRPYTANGLLQFCRRLGARAHVDHCHPHTFRRTFATWCLENGMDVYTLQRLMGHADLSVLLRYLNQSRSHLQREHRAHGAIDNMI